MTSPEAATPGVKDRASAPPGFGATRRATAAILIGFGLLYALMPTRNWSYADDSCAWALSLVAGDAPVVNSHHLYLNYQRAIYRAFLAGPPALISPEGYLSLYSALLGALGLAGLHRLLIRLGLSAAALPATLFCGLTAGYWTYSIIGDAYVPAAALLVLGSLGLVAAIDRIRDGQTLAKAAPPALLSGACIWLAILHHQAHFVFAIGMLVAALAVAPGLRGRATLAGLFAAASAGALCVATYLVLYLQLPSSTRPQIPQFMAGYAGHFVHYPDMKNLSLQTVKNSVMGLGRALFASEFLFVHPTVAEKLQQRFPYRHMYWHVYLVKDVPVWKAGALAGATAISALAVAVFLLRGLWTALRQATPARVVLACAACQAVFFAWWEGVSDEFWLWSLPFVAILLAHGAAAMRSGPRWLTAIALLTGLATYGGAVSLFRDPSADLDERNKAYLAHVAPSDLIIALDEIAQSNKTRLRGVTQQFQYLNLFGDMEKGRPIDFDALRSRIDATLAAGNAVFIDPYLVDPPRSYVALLRLNGPDFEPQWAGLQALIRSLADRVRIVEPTVAIPSP